MDPDRRALEAKKLAVQLTAAMFEPKSLEQQGGNERQSGQVRLLSVTFVSATFLGAFLLFLIEPIFAKLALPLVGGSPAIWTTAVLFFQLALLASYAYVHALRKLPLLAGFALHIVLLGAAAFFLPFSISGSQVDVVDAPVLAILTMLLRSAGLPFFALAATSPLLQLWLSKTATRAAANPYPLYAASNLGSLSSLLIYPFAIEPFTVLHEQSFGWAIAFLLFVVSLGCAYALTSRARGTDVPDKGTIEAPVPLGAARRLHWVALAFVPSSVMLGATAHLSATIAPMPLLWTVPLALYLATFVIAFSERTRTLRYALLRATPLAVPLALLLLAIRAAIAVPAYVELQLAVVFLLSLACHGVLAEDAPAPASLTEFYLWISVGGALGGAFNAIVAPVLFPTVLEYPIAIVLGCALGAVFEKNERTKLADFALPGALCVALVCSFAIFGASAASPATRITLALGAVACFAFSRRRVRFALGAAALVVAGTLTVPAEGRALSIERNFFGVKTVFVDPSRHLQLFVHSATVHGIQSTDASLSREPLSYYARAGPLGDAMRAIRARRGEHLRVTAAGLGIGSVACYARPRDAWTYLEIDPAVLRLARSPFTFLSQCTPHARVVIGDARLSLESLNDQNDIIVLDAYTSDSPPLHLLSREALALYLQRLAPHGYLVFNISNRFFDLAPVLASEAAATGLHCWVSRYDAPQAQSARGVFPSDWAVLMRDVNDFAGFDEKRWQPCVARGGIPLWTDDYSSLLRLWLPG